MGIGIIALVSLFYARYLPLLKRVSVDIFYLSIAIFFLLLILWIMRWIFFPKNAFSDLKHRVISNFYPILPIGILVLSADYIVIGKNFYMGEIFWFIGAIFTIFFLLLIPLITFKRQDVKLDHINPGWFILPLGLIVIPISGSLLINVFMAIIITLYYIHRIKISYSMSWWAFTFPLCAYVSCKLCYWNYI